MYTLAIRRDLIAQHYLVGGDWGAENERHSHHYQIEVQIEAEHLDRHGFLVDILDLEAALDSLVGRFRDQTLNDQPEFAGLNPSLENFCRILCQGMAGRIQAEDIAVVSVRLWENQIAWAAYRMEK